MVFSLRYMGQIFLRHMCSTCSEYSNISVHALSLLMNILETIEERSICAGVLGYIKVHLQKGCKYIGHDLGGIKTHSLSGYIVQLSAIEA